MSPILRPLLTMTLCLLINGAGFAGELRQKSFAAKSYSGSRDRQYQVFVPSSYNGQDPVPLVMVLHGCNQTEANMINETRFKDLAERDNFIVVYPFITSYDDLRASNCWGFFIDQHIHKGAGEVEDLHQIALEVEAEFKIDPNRRYVTGLSSGAGMSVALAVAQSAYFAAAGSVEGLPYSETASSVGFICANPGMFKPVSAAAVAMQREQKQSEDQRVVPIMAIHSRNDCVVNILGSRNIRDSWIRRYGLDPGAVATSDCTAKGVACTQTKYGTAERSAVETVFYDGKRGDLIGTDSHYWVGDNSGKFADPKGPSASELQWAFFKSHPFRESQPPSVSITSATATGNAVTVSGTASVPAGSIASATVRLDGRFPQPSKTASGTTDWNVTFDNLPSDAFYVPVAAAKGNDGATTSATGTPIAVGSPPANAPPSVMINRASVTGDCVTVAGNASDPEGQLAGVEVELGARGRKNATLGENTFKYQECGLPAGTHSTKVQATDTAGAKSPVISGPDVSVSDIQSVTANWQAHMGAGRLNIFPASVEINGGQNRSARPGEDLSMTFVADMFAFGSDKSEYLIFSIIPEQKSPAGFDRPDIDQLHLFAYVLGSVENQPGIRQGARPTVRLVAPNAPGKYKIIYNRVPYFARRPFAAGGPPGSTFVPSRGDSADQELARHLWEHRSEFAEAVPIVVAERTPGTTLVPPDLYFSVNGETPGLEPLRTGTVETPLTFRWSVNSDFPLPRQNLSYRYQMTIDGDVWSEWSPASEKLLFFLPKGAHEFRVQAKYDGPEGTVTSQIAHYSFILSAPFVARPTKEALSKPATLGNIARSPMPDIGAVYSGSRALLFGIYSFEDRTAFAQLPKDRIERDVTTLKSSLARNGFDVTTVVRPSITTRDVRLAIDDFIKSSRNNERLFIYFSSHGFADPNQPADGYVATTDCQARSASATCLALDSLRQQFNESMDRDARQIVIAVDSCFAGLGVVVKSVPDSNLGELARRKGIHMLTAGMEHQTAQIDDAFKMSTFTYYLAQGMDGGADIFKNGVISLTELFLYVQYQVADRTQSSQIPMMGRILGSGEMLFHVPTPRQAAQ